jgi:hypothetical protein
MVLNSLMHEVLTLLVKIRLGRFAEKSYLLGLICPTNPAVNLVEKQRLGTHEYHNFKPL